MYGCGWRPPHKRIAGASIMPWKNCNQRQRHPHSRQISGQRRRWSQRPGDRRLLLETLESRLALSGDPLSASQRQELINGLGYLATWTGDLSETAQLGSPLAISGLSVGQSANVEQMIQTGIVSQLSATSQSAVNTDQFVDAIRGLSRTTGDCLLWLIPLASPETGLPAQDAMSCGSPPTL